MNRYEANIQSKLPYDIIVLTDKKAEAVVEIVPNVGFNAYKYTLQGTEIIAGPPALQNLFDRSSEFGIPALFPPNRVRNGEISFEGRIYSFPINDSPNHLHGLIRQLPWKIREFGSNEESAYVTAELDTAEHVLLSYYPHHLIFRFTYILYDGKLQMRGEITNKSKDNAPFGLGFHPYFSCGSSPADQVKIKVPVIEQFELNESGFPEGAPVSNERCHQVRSGVHVSEFPSIPDHMLFRVSSSSEDTECIIQLLDQKAEIRFRFDSGFLFLVLFKPAWMNAVSVEPYTCITNAFNMKLPEGVTGARSLHPGESYKFHWDVSLIDGGGLGGKKI